MVVNIHLVLAHFILSSSVEKYIETQFVLKLKERQA